jgi:hypothetical protein
MPIRMTRKEELKQEKIKNRKRQKEKTKRFF